MNKHMHAIHVHTAFACTAHLFLLMSELLLSLECLEHLLQHLQKDVLLAAMIVLDKNK